MRSPGGVPERPKGTGCKPVGSAYGGSNPPAPTHSLAQPARPLSSGTNTVQQMTRRLVRAGLTVIVTGLCTAYVLWKIEKAIEEWTGGGPQKDDVTMIAVKVLS